MAKKHSDTEPDPQPDPTPDPDLHVAAVDPSTAPGYQEYPKWVHPEGGPDTIVTDAAHEAAVMGDVKASRG